MRSNASPKKPGGTTGVIARSTSARASASAVEHALHQLGRPLTPDDLRAHRQLVVRESGSTRATRVSLEATQRWTVSPMTTSIEAARLGYAYAWLPEEKIREELASGALKPLTLREGGDRYVELYLVYSDRDAAGPGVLRLGEIIRETTREACAAEAAKRPRRRKRSA
jgi:DNA-binding transcriptional LysR family regulator